MGGKSTVSMMYVPICQRVDGTPFSTRYLADVSDPKAEATTTWPDDTADRCFVICSPYRAYFVVAETPEEKT